MSDSAGPTPPAGQGQPLRRAAANPFMQKKRRFAQGAPKPVVNGGKPPPPPKIANQLMSNGLASAPQSRPNELQALYRDFEIAIEKPFGGQGVRYHSVKLQNKPNKDGTFNPVDPYSEEQFTRPLRLHRRFTRDKQIMVDAEQNGADDKEREMYNQKRAERQAEREANQALIAPSGNSKKPPIKRKKGQKNIEDVYYDENNPKQQKAAQLRYEETKPWHLEDFGNGTTPKNVWVGAYQEPLSESSVLFEIKEDGFYAVPVERHYIFRQTDRISVMDSEEVEKHMSRKYNPGRWYLNTQDKNEEIRKIKAESRRRANDDDEKPNKGQLDSYRADLDELDFEAKDEFQDDDEGHIFGEDEEMANEVEKKVREEMREANLPATNMKNEDQDYDAAEDQEREDQRAQRKQQKKLRKRIVKHEKKYEYDSDSEHPYSESSDEEDSEEERQRLEDERKKEEATAAAAAAAAATAAKLAANGGKSGTSTHGNNTPAQRSEKHDRSRLSVGNSLKRPGSPSLSEVSGNESRKKLKSMNGRAVSSSNIAADGARSPLSRSMAGYGSGSETDASRVGRARNKRLATGSPHEGSRPGSRAVSPGRSDTPPPRLPTIEELLAVIPPNGISIKDIGARFKARVSKDKTAEFIALIKNNTVQDPVSKLLKPAATSTAES